MDNEYSVHTRSGIIKSFNTEPGMKFFFPGIEVKRITKQIISSTSNNIYLSINGIQYQVTFFYNWLISDPALFFSSFSDQKEAEIFFVEQLQNKISESAAIKLFDPDFEDTGEYKFKPLHENLTFPELENIGITIIEVYPVSFFLTGDSLVNAEQKLIDQLNDEIEKINADAKRRLDPVRKLLESDLK